MNTRLRNAGHVLAALMLASMPACVNPVFNSPATISTRSSAARDAKLLKPVRTESTSYFFLLIPYIPDPRDVYDDLLAEAHKAGGNAVVDVQVRSERFFAWLLPPIVADTIEAQGMAAIVE